MYKTSLCIAVFLFFVALLIFPANIYAITNTSVLTNPNFTTSAGDTSGADEWQNITEGACDTARISKWVSGEARLNSTCLGKNDAMSAKWTQKFAVNSSMTNPSSVSLDFNHSFWVCTTCATSTYTVNLTYPNGSVGVLFSNTTGTTAYRIYSHLDINVSNFTDSGDYNISVGIIAKTGNANTARISFTWDDVQFTYTYPAITSVSVTQELSMTGTVTSSVTLAPSVTTYRPNVTEPLTLTPNIINILSASRGITNVLDIFDLYSSLQSLIKSSTNAVDLTDAPNRFQRFQKTTTEALTSADRISFILSRVRTITDALDITDNIQILLTRVRQITDSISFTDRIQTLFNRVRFLTNALSLGNVITTQVTIPVVNRAVTLAITTADNLQRIFSTIKLTTNAISLTNVVTATLTRLVQLTQALDITDTVQVLFTRVRLLTDAIDLTESASRLASFLRSLTSPVDLADSITSPLARLRSLTDALDVTDNVQILFTRVRLITNAIDLTESMTRLVSFTRSLTNAVDLSEVAERFRILLKNVTDSFTLAERITTAVFKLFPRTVTAALDVTDNIQILLTRVRSVTNAMDINENITVILTHIKLITNSIDLAESTKAVITLLRQVTGAVDVTEGMQAILTRMKLLTNAMDLTETVQNIFTRVRLVSDALDINELTTRIFTAIKQLTNSITFVERITTTVFKLFPRTVTAALDVTENLATALTRVRLLTEAVDLSESMNRLTSLIRFFTNALDLTELTGRFRTMSLQVTGALDITDNIQALLTRVRSINNTIGVADNIKILFTRVRLPTNVIGLADGISRLISFTLSLTNAADLSETITSSLGRLRKVTQAFDLAENIQALLTRVRLVTDALDVTDTTAKLLRFTRTFTNALGVTDIAERFRTLTKSVTDSFAFTERIRAVALKAFSRTVTETLGLSDGIQNLFTRVRLVTNAVDLAEIASRLFSFVRNLTNAADLADSITSPLARLRSLTDALDVTDNVQNLFARVRLITNAIDVTELTGRMFSLTRSLTNAIDLSEIANRFRIIPRQLSDALSIADSIRTNLGRLRQVTVPIDLTEFTSRIVDFRRAVSLQFLVTAVTATPFKTVSASFTIPVTSLSQGQFAEFDINVQNTGNEKMNVTTGVDVYNSSHLVTTVNSTNVTLSAGQSKTIITFMNTANMTAGNYRTEGSVFFDGRSTINMTKYFNLTNVGNVQTGAYTNTSINFTANTPILIIANTTTTTIVNISIILNSTQENAFSVSEFSTVPNKTVSNLKELNKFIDITVNENITNSLKWFWLNVSYTDSEISAAGLSESNLRIWFYNTTSTTWQQESDSGVDTSANYVWANVSHFSLFGIYATVPSQPSTTTPSTTTGGGGGGTLSTLPTVKTEFVKWPILREVKAGQSIVEGIKVKNKGTDILKNLQIQVSGVPPGWISIVPNSIDLQPNEYKTFNLAVSVPKDTDRGDYKLLITLKGSNIEDSSFIILRVKDYAPSYDRPIVERIVELDYEHEKTKVTLNVNNPLKYYELVQVKEEIPKSISQSAKEVEFNPYPDEIIREDPLVQWDIKEFAVNETKTLSYATKGILDEFTDYIYFPLKEMNIIETKLPTGLKLVDVSVGTMYAGKSTAGKIIVENIGDEEKKLEFSMQLPPSWRMVPERIEANVAAHERKEFKFSIVVPEDTSPGDYIATSIILWDTDTHIKEHVLQVASTSLVTGLALFGGIATTSLVGYFIWSFYRTRIPPMSNMEKLRKIRTSILSQQLQIQQSAEFSDVIGLKDELVEDVRSKLRHEVMKRLNEEEEFKIRKRE
ncbi:MAG: hypothetical protein HYW24_05300 [Candidatus Aenigmarchaeota archaeon]|nr:hypothetical protein [Candidatus Aenigmarchaeota archaeon]